MGAAEEIQAALHELLSAFNANDAEGYKQSFDRSLAFSLGGEAQLHDGMPLSPLDIKTAGDFTHSTELESEVLAATDDTGIVLLRGNRRRADESIKSALTAVYHFRRTADGWKCNVLMGVEVLQD